MLLPNTKYYYQIAHRNSIETWSAAGGTTLSRKRPFYDFTATISNAFGNNLILKAGRYCIYGGDVNADGIADALDQALTDNDAFNIATGYLATDVNGDGVVDAADLALIDNNAFNFVQKIVP